jgi:hypothetical protein
MPLVSRMDKFFDDTVLRMSHRLGRVVPDGRTFTQTSGLDFTPGPGPLGGPRFVILHFTDVHLTGSAKLTVNLGYGTDVFSSGAGADFWSRPVDPSTSPIALRISGGTGSARLLEFGSGEPSIPIGQTPGTSSGSKSNPDVFLQTNPYEEPIFETRLECTAGFAWRNSACGLPLVPDAVKDRVAAATGIIVEVHEGAVSSCSGTLVGPDMFLVARHCLTNPTGADVSSASVTFDYATACDLTRPAGHVTKFFKVVGEVASGSAPTGANPPAATDWVVVRLDGAPGGLPAPLIMRDAAPMAGETIFTMHHPNGAVKKMQSGVHGGGGSITGFDYAGGSSGSALFDINGQLAAGPLSSGSGCSVVYAPIANVKAGLLHPPPPPRPLDVMIVFDKSGSMASPAPPAGRTKLKEAQDAASLFTQLVREGAGDRLGLVTFSSTADLPVPEAPAAAAKPLLTGAAPFTGGQIGAITAGGSTSIGQGVGIALLAFGGGSTNDRAVLLLTDGMQNTPPTIEEIEPSLGTTKLNVIGFGSDADIDGPLLSRLAREHHGQFTRAIDGMALRKFFGLAFGNIFETGALSDPEFVLKASQTVSEPHKFSVCGEERITLVIGWDRESTPLQAHITTPAGKPVTFGRRSETARGLTWAFYRIPLPYGGERDGTWQFTVDRVGGGVEFSAAATPDVRYFFLVICAGGPKLTYLGGPRHVYTGDAINPLVGLHYSNRKAPDAQMRLIIEGPTVALGQLTMQAGLRPPSTTADAVTGFFSTLQAVQRQAGGVLPVGKSTVEVELFDDGLHNDGGLEPDGIYNNVLKDLTRVEGTYLFHAVAAYGDGCRATREAFWSIHVEPGIDPGRSEVTLVNVTDQSGGKRGTLVIFPRDPYGNPLGPGRGGKFTATPLTGVKGDAVKDRGDGSYGIDVTWDPTVAPVPGVIVQQPDRNPTVMTPPSSSVPPPPRDCTKAAGDLLDCLGLPASDVKRVRVKSVCIEVDLKDSKCEPDC